MIIKCDTEKMENISKNIDLQIDRYKEIIKQFYEMVDHLENYGWVGNTSKNYQKYLNNKKKKYNNIYNILSDFNGAIKNNIRDIEYAISTSGVNEND